MTTTDGQGFMLSPDDDDWPDPDDPRWYDTEDDHNESFTAAERNPSLLSQ